MKYLHNSGSKQPYIVKDIEAPEVNAWRTGCGLTEVITMVRGLLQEVQWS